MRKRAKSGEKRKITIPPAFPPSPSGLALRSAFALSRLALRSASTSLFVSRSSSPCFVREKRTNDCDMSAGELLEVDPLELKFPFELRKQISCSLQLSNKTDDHIAFKVKTTNPKKYCVRPNNGVVLPRSICDVVVTMQAQREAPPDMQCKDKFLVQSVVINPGISAKDIASEMFSRDSGNKFEEVRLKVVYVSPPQPPSPVHEGSDEGSSPRASATENGNLDTSEPVVQLRENVAHQINSVETMDLISRLTEERNDAMQLSYKLREEIELVKREVSKQHGGGFSLMFVAITALLGILVGYLVKA